MTAHPPDRSTGHDVTSLRTALVRAASVFALLALFSAWVGTIGNAGTASTVAKLLFFLSLVFFMILLTFAIIVGKPPK
jgi:uncharacterized membrane protein YtjA (UPF0391 family)